MLSTLLLLAACTGAEFTDGADPETGSEAEEPPDPSVPGGRGWSGAPALLAPLQEHAVVALDGEVVVLGGYDDRGRMVDRVEAFDPAVGTWRALAPLPEPSHHVNAAVVNGRIYVLGVLQGGFLEEAVTWIYDPAADAWEEGTPPPFERAAGSSTVAVVGTQVHLIGGLRSTRAVPLHSVYDTVADRWEILPDSPRDRDHAGGGALGDLVFAVSGREGPIASVFDAVDRYDVVEQAWEPGAPIPTARAGVAAALDPDGRLHVVGGEGSEQPSGVFGQHEVYDPEADAWDPLPPMRTPRHGMGAVFVGGVLYVPGGADVAGFGALDTFERYVP